MAASKRPVKRTAAKKTAKKAAPAKRTPRQPTRDIDLAAARKAAQLRDEETAALQQGDDLPLLVVKGAPRPKARLQLGEGGTVYTVTKPKDDYYWDMMDRLAELQGLATLTTDLTQLTDEDTAKLRTAVATLEEFVTCVFDPADHDEVLTHLRDPATPVAKLDLADAMTQLMNEVWAPDTEDAEEE